MGCKKQVLFRSCAVVTGEHDFPDFEFVRDTQREDIMEEGSPARRGREELLIDYAPGILSPPILPSPPHHARG